MPHLSHNRKLPQRDPTNGSQSKAGYDPPLVQKETWQSLYVKISQVIGRGHNTDSYIAQMRIHTIEERSRRIPQFQCLTGSGIRVPSERPCDLHSQQKYSKVVQVLD